MFKAKLARKPLKTCFPPAAEAHDISDDTNVDQCAEFIKKLFLAKNRNPQKTVYTHITTAVDTRNVEFVFNAVVSSILEENLRATGLSF